MCVAREGLRLYEDPRLRELYVIRMVPLYDVFCEVFGINGKTAGQAEVQQVVVDTSRTVTVEFVATVDRGPVLESFEAEGRTRVRRGGMVAGIRPFPAPPGRAPTPPAASVGAGPVCAFERSLPDARPAS